jgi:hypothetical protein
MHVVSVGCAYCPGVPAGEEPPSDEVLAALVASLGQELADALGALEETCGELARARERIAELEARLEQDAVEFLEAAAARGWTSRRRSGRCGRRPAASPAGRTDMRAPRWRRWPGRIASYATTRAAAAGAVLAWRAGRSPGWNAAMSSTCRK